MSRMSALTTLRLIGSPTKPGWPYCAPCETCAVWFGFEVRDCCAPESAAADDEPSFLSFDASGVSSTTRLLQSRCERSRGGARNETCRLVTASPSLRTWLTVTCSTSGEVTA